MTVAFQAAPLLLSDLNREAELCWLACHSGWPGFTVEVLPTVDSTNLELMRRARSGELPPTVLVAHAQTAGKGRMGKAWASDSGACLMFSFGCSYRPAHWSGLSLAVGVALAQALGPQVMLKWPNDLWVNRHKLGGILIETAVTGPERQLVVGVGINWQVPALPPAGATDTASVTAVPPTGWSTQADQPPALSAVVPALLNALKTFEASGFPAFTTGFAQRDALHGLSVRCTDGTHGTAVGVDAQGALLVQTDAGARVAVHSQEVSVRPC